MATIFSAALAVFFPVACAGCATPDVALCTECNVELRPAPFVTALADGTRAWAGLPYGGVLRNVLLQFKENNRTDTAVFLAPVLASAIGSAERDAVMRGVLSAGEPFRLVCVPSSAAAWRRRGYHPTERLVRRAGFVCSPVLASVAGGSIQKSLTVQQRLVNRRGAFRSRRDLSGWRIILVDDVLTTGATLSAAVETIRWAGGSVVGVAVAAFTAKSE
jgi:predicted amidophosphoribosyltransferase